MTHFLQQDKGEIEKEKKVSDQVKPKGDSETIMVVEDEEAVCKMVCQIVRNLGYNVIEA